VAATDPRHPLVVALIKARYDAGLTQAQVGARIGQSHSAIGNWECGARSPRVETLTAWASALGLRLALLRETPRG